MIQHLVRLSFNINSAGVLRTTEELLMDFKTALEEKSSFTLYLNLMQ
jgi:hypothetical protein